MAVVNGYPDPYPLERYPTLGGEMGLSDKLRSFLTGETVKPAQPPSSGGIKVTYTSSASPSVHVSDVEVAEFVQKYAFVLNADPPALKAADQWWNEAAHKRRRREGSDKAYAWIQLFIPIEVAKLKELHAAQENGPYGAHTIAKALRALIRERRKAKEPHEELLQALYGACVAAHFSASLGFKDIGPVEMSSFVDINELRSVEIDFKTMGYECVESLSKTDVKWLVEAFGEPADHQSFEGLWPEIGRNALARYCWSELRSSSDARRSLDQPQKTMQEWLSARIKMNLGYFKEWQERVAGRQADLAERAAQIEAAWAATRQPFVVADLETTGLSADTDDVIEFAALRVTPDGGITDEFSALVRPLIRLPDEITRLTGITQDAIDREGRPPTEAMKAFVKFVSADPVFFHNAAFDHRFIKKMAKQAKVKFANPVHDTLPLARKAWPSLNTYKLTALAQHVGTTVPTHRALEDAKATLAVLLAARQTVTPK